MQNSQWLEPVVGFEYSPETLSVTTEHQREKLHACGLDADRYGTQVDPAFFIGIGIHAGIRSGISAEGNVNMVQTLIQHRPALLEEPLTVYGKITQVSPVPRGLRVFTDVWFADEKGERVITASRLSLRPDPEKAAARGAGERPKPVIVDPTSLSVLHEHQLTPRSIKAYSMEGNSIHYEEAAAQRAGFRAPIIGGGMGVHYLTDAIREAAGKKTVQRVALNIYFRRPIFWDQAISIACDGQIDAPEHWRALGLVHAGKVLTEASIDELVLN